MYYFIILLSFLFIASPQESDKPTLSVFTVGSVELPADIIRFDINMNATGDTPQSAYELQKKREKTLVQLLDRYGVKENDIRFQPVSITKATEYDKQRNKVITYNTHQNVSLTLKDFNVYEQIQVQLIEAGFDNFSGHFTSTEMEEGKNKALKDAIHTARMKADIIAKEAGLRITGIKHISYSQNQVRPYAANAMELKSSSDARLLKYDQTVTVHANITVEFYFENASAG